MVVCGAYHRLDQCDTKTHVCSQPLGTVINVIIQRDMATKDFDGGSGPIVNYTHHAAFEQ